jgi:hypothetical protein
MKKVIKSKLFFGEECLKNLFLWEVIDDNGIRYEIIEEIKNHKIQREVFHGWYSKKALANSDFEKLIESELAGLPHERVAFI